MYKIINKKHHGVTSLLFVLVIGLILVVMVAGIAALTIREQQQASRTDLSNRALYAAEAGVKLAAQKLSDDKTYSSSTCTQRLSEGFSDLFTSNSNQAITCMIIQSVFTDYQEYVPKDLVVRLLVGPDITEASTSPTLFSIQWNNPSLGDVTSGWIYPGNLYPEKDNYTYAANIELTFIYWPSRLSTNPVNSSNIQIKKFLLAPGNNTNPSDTYVNSICSGQSGVTAPLTDYKCTSTAKNTTNGQFNIGTALGNINPQSYNFAIIVGSRYKGTHIQVNAFNNDGSTKLNMKSASAQIDSTARAGNLYRRIKASKLINVTGALENVLDGPIYSGPGSNVAGSEPKICKNFVVKETSSGSGSYMLANGTVNCNGLSL